MSELCSPRERALMLLFLFEKGKQQHAGRHTAVLTPR